MENLPSYPENIYKHMIYFPNRHYAHAVYLPPNSNPSIAISLLMLPYPKAVIIIAGGASLLHPHLYPALRALFTDAIARLATTLPALVIDGGTQSGVMELLGSAIAAQPRKPHARRRSTLLGIVPASTVTFPGQEYPDPDVLSTRADLSPLDPNHSHFVLVGTDTDTWGDETPAMYELAHLLTRRCPSVAIAINGGSITQTEILYNVRQRRPIVVLTGSGRIVDTIAHLWQNRPASIPDPTLAEIIRDGDIHLFPSTSPATELIQLLQHLLSL